MLCLTSIARRSDLNPLQTASASGSLLPIIRLFWFGPTLKLTVPPDINLRRCKSWRFYDAQSYQELNRLNCQWFSNGPRAYQVGLIRAVAANKNFASRKLRSQPVARLHASTTNPSRPLLLNRVDSISVFCRAEGAPTLTRGRFVRNKANA